MIRILKDEDEVLNLQDGILYFYTDSCGICNLLDTYLDDLELMVLKIDTNIYASLALDLFVERIPSLILYKDGMEISRLIGFHNKEDVMHFLNAN